MIHLPRARFVVAALAIALLVVAAGCGGSSSGGSSTATTAAASTGSASNQYNLNSAGTLEVGMNLQYKPQMYLDDNGKPAGYDVELLNALADQMGVKLQIDNLDFNGLIPGLVSKKFDLVSVGLSPTPERQKAVDFTRAYVPYAQVLAVKKGDTTPATKAAWNDPGKTITSLQGSTAEQLVAKEFPKAQSKSFPDQNAAFLQVATGRADAVVVENYLLAQFNKSNGNKLEEAPFEKPLHVEYGAWAVQKGNSALVDYLNGFLCDIQTSGRLASIYKSTIGAELPLMPAC